MRTLLQKDTPKKVLAVLIWIAGMVAFVLLLSSCTLTGGIAGQDRHYKDQEKYMRRYHSEVRARRARLKKGWHTMQDNVSTTTGMPFPQLRL